MSNYPNNYDDDSTLPVVNDNLTEIGGEAINALRDAVVQIETALGLNIAGSSPSLAVRLGVFINPDGSPNVSVMTSLGLVTLPIRNDQIAEAAGIPESKLRLDFRTQDLFNYIRDLSLDINSTLGWINTQGIKLEPHLIGAIYRHTMDQVDVSLLTSQFLSNKFRTLRNNINSYEVVNDMNDELLAHQWADGSDFGVIQNVVTNNGSVYPSNYAHTASGIFINSSRFITVPQTNNDLQLFAEYIDSASIFLLGTRIQNLYTSGISRTSTASSLTIDGYGSNIVPSTPAIAYLRNIGNSSGPFDNIDTGDDIIEFKPSTTDSNNNTFDAKFALVKPGHIVRVNYGTIEVAFVIKEKKYSQSGGNKKFIVRVAGKNIAYAPNAIARVDQPLYNNNKYGVLAVAAANNNFVGPSSLIVATPRGGEALGLGFSPDQFDENHYLLHLALYPTGNPQDGYTFMPGIDVTGNQGKTPGLYTLVSTIPATNAAFRQLGYNYRFIAFSNGGEFGIILADSYGGAAFSIVNGVVSPGGVFNVFETQSNFPKNVVDVFPTVGIRAPDPLGFGVFGSGIASPPYLSTYGSPEAAQFPTRLLFPLRRNNFYVNGIEKERLTIDVDQVRDALGDGYWVARIVDQQIPAGRVQNTYRINQDLTTSQLKIGKTVVIQSLGQGSIVDFGRFTITDVTFGCSPTQYTDITVYDAVHAKGFSPPIPLNTLGVDGYVALYFNSDSVSFNTESATDFASVTPFKRHFELYVDANSYTFTHERGRILINGSSVVVNSPNGTTLYSTTDTAKLDIIKISPKLRGFQFGSVNKISLNVTSYNSTTGVFDGYLGSYNGSNLTRLGPVSTGKKGQVTRFYDETHIDYIDLIFDINVAISSMTNQIIDFQLFPTLSLDGEIMMIGTCQYNDTSKAVNRVRDERQFGNTSEKDLSTSALAFLALPEKHLHMNGLIRGFEVINVTNEFILLTGGIALAQGNFQFINEGITTISKVRELFSFSYYPINWALCVNSVGEVVTIPLTDFDSVVGTPNSPTRLMQLFNVVSSTTYEANSTTFTNLVNNRKDLTILYIVTSTVTGSGPSATVSLSLKDVRRYINDVDSNLPAIITTDSAQGNFKNVNTALNWLRFNNPLQNTLIIKGTVTVSSGLTHTGGQLNVYPQGSGSTFTVGGPLTATNFRFTDLPVIVQGAAVLTSTIMQNAPLTVQGNLTASGFDFSKSNGISIFGSVLNATNSQILDGSFISTGGGTFISCNLSNHSTFSTGGTSSFNTCIANNNVSCTIGGAGTFTNSQLQNIGTFTVSGTGIYNNCSMDNYATFLTSGNATFTDCIVNDVTSMTVTGNGSFINTAFDHVTSMTVNGTSTVQNSQINDASNLVLVNTSTFTNSNIDNVLGLVSGTPMVVANMTFTDCVINNLFGTTSGVLEFNTTEVYNAGVGSAGITVTSSSFNGYTATTAGPLTTTSSTFVNTTLNSLTTVSISGSKSTNLSVTCSGNATITNSTFENSTISVDGYSTITNCKFINCALTFTGGGNFTNVYIDPSTITIGSTITTNGLTIVDSILSISAVRGFTLNNNFIFSRNSVTWTGDPVSGYEPTDIVNSGNGLMYGAIGDGYLNNIVVEDNIFNTSLQNRFPFFSIQLNNFSSVAKNISVSKNKFTSTSVAEDLRAVIAVVSTLLTRADLGVFPQFPLLTDVHFDDNVCNYNQLIIITGTKNLNIGVMNGANPVVINTTISRNTCGTIGYFIGSAGPYDGNNVGSPNNGTIRDKVNKLVIDGNYCKFIANLDYRGDYICFRATRFPDANSYEEVASTVGDSTISNNTCNWIQVGVGGYTIGPSICEIVNNNVSPFNSTFLSFYSSQTIFQTIIPGNVGILVRRPHNATDLTAASVISGNSLNQKNTTTASPGVVITGATGPAFPGTVSPIVITTQTTHSFTEGQIVNISGVAGNTAANGTWFVGPSPTATTFKLSGSVSNDTYTGGGIAVATNVYYYEAGIATFNNSRIINNKITGVVNSDNAPLIYLWNVFKSCIISDNILERKGLNCKAFIWFDRHSAPSNDGVSIFVSDNLLDDVKFTSGALDRAFLSFTSYNSSFEKGVVVMNNLVQTSTGVNVYEVRYTNGKSTIIPIP